MALDERRTRMKRMKTRMRKRMKIGKSLTEAGEQAGEATPSVVHSNRLHAAWPPVPSGVATGFAWRGHQWRAKATIQQRQVEVDQTTWGNHECGRVVDQMIRGHCRQQVATIVNDA